MGKDLFDKDRMNRPTKRRDRRRILEDRLLRALSRDFQTYGASAIRACRERSPARYLDLAIRLLPQEVKIEAGADLTALLEQAATQRINSGRERTTIEATYTEDVDPRLVRTDQDEGGYTSEVGEGKEVGPITQ